MSIVACFAILFAGGYGALMTDVYPPFRLDMGGDEPPADSQVIQPADGEVIGTPRRLLRFEGAVLSIGALIAYSTTDRAWWLVPLTLLVPDLTMIGYLGGTRLGAYLYNLGHSTPLPAAVVAIGWWQDKSLIVALGLVWLAHIGLDRLLGYGLKYGDHFQHTHLGRLGKGTRAAR